MRIMHAIVIVAFATSPVLAQSASAQAETLFRQGKDLLAAGKIAEACAAFDGSQQLEPAITTQLNQAACRERNRQYASSWGAFVDVVRQTRSATDEESVQFHRVASERAAKLEPILSKLTIAVPTTVQLSGLAITRGATAVGAGEWNHPLPVDGGAYTITATAPGHESWSVTVKIGPELDTKSISIPVLRGARVATSRAPTPPRAKLPLILGAGSLVAGGLALAFELWSERTYGNAKREIDNTRQRELTGTANTERHLAQGFGVASAASAGVAVWLYLRDRRERRALSIQPLVSTDHAGVSLGGRW